MRPTQTYDLRQRPASTAMKLVHTEEVTGSIPVSPTDVRPAQRPYGQLSSFAEDGSFCRLGGIWEIVFFRVRRNGTVVPSRRSHPGHGTQASARARVRVAGSLCWLPRPPDDRLVAVAEQGTGDVVPERWNAVGPKSGMWMDPAQDPRFAAGAELEGERATLLDYLRGYGWRWN